MEGLAAQPDGLRNPQDLQGGEREQTQLSSDPYTQALPLPDLHTNEQINMVCFHYRREKVS